MQRTLAIVLFALAACGGGGAGGGGGGDGGGGGGGGMDAPPGGSDASGGTDAMTAGNATIFTIVMENHDYNEIVGSSNAPYINNTLLPMAGLATNYKDSGTHPSLPNYLYLISGATQYIGIVDLDPTTSPFPVDQPNLATQLEAANVKWRSYAEDEGTACNLTDVGNYAPKHVPFLYFTDQQKAPNSLCADTNVDFGQFAADLAANTYRYMWITPNLLDDGHNPTTDPVMGIKDTDTWLSQHVPDILASDGYKNGGIVFITWDEAEGRNGDDPDKVPMIILSPKLKQAGMTSATAFTHASYTATIEDLLGMPRLATVTSATNLMEFLNP